VCVCVCVCVCVWCVCVCVCACVYILYLLDFPPSLEEIQQRSSEDVTPLILQVHGRV